MVATLALVGPGDEILCPVPTYSVYLQQAALLGATIVEVPCEPEDDFIMMPHNVEKLITPRTKVLVHSESKKIHCCLDTKKTRTYCCCVGLFGLTVGSLLFGHSESQ